MAIQFNVKGGDGDATLRFNSHVTDRGASDSVINRMIARGAHIGTMSMNEVCWSQYQDIVWYVGVAGYPYGPSFYAAKTGGLTFPCGGKYGSVALVNGGAALPTENSVYYWQSTSAPYNVSSEMRGIACVANIYYWACSTHLLNGNNWVTQNQEYDFRIAMKNFAALGRTVYTAGDFNMPVNPSAPWYNAWFQNPNPFIEADAGTTGNRYTYRDWWPYVGSAKIDYLYRRATASWASNPYIESIGYSDHSWYQAYIA